MTVGSSFRPPQYPVATSGGRFPDQTGNTQRQPKKKATDKSKYSVALVFKPGTDLTAMQEAVLEAATDRWGTKAAEMLRKGQLRSPFRKDAESKGYEDGSVFINARSDNQPGLVYLHAEPGTTKPAKVAPEDIKTVFYPGAIVRAQLSAFTYDTDGNKGVSFGLNHVQKIAEGERIDGRQDASEVFDADLSAAPAELKDLVG
jgi:hypothetical protein